MNLVLLVLTIAILHLKKYLFGAVTLTKNTDIEKYGYSGYRFGFDRRGSFSFPGGKFGQNVLIFGVDMSSSAHMEQIVTYLLMVQKFTNLKKKILKLW